MNWNEVINDFRKKYINSYVVGVFNSKEDIFVIKEVTEEGKIITASSDGNFEFYYGSSYITIKNKLPPIGYFVSGESLFLLTKRGSRQWKRGISEDMFRLEKLDSLLRPYSAPFTFENIKDAFASPKSFKYKDAEIKNNRFLIYKNEKVLYLNYTLLGVSPNELLGI